MGEWSGMCCVFISTWSIAVCMMANYCLLAVLNQEKTIHKIGEFDKTKLKHAETEVKNPLPDKEGERSAFYSDLL